MDLHFAPWTLATSLRFPNDDRHLVTIPERIDESSAIRGVGTTS